MANKKTKKAKESNYVITIRSAACPAIAANIFRGTSADGHTYLYFEISRSWKSGAREGYSNRYYSRNVDGIVEVAREASAWIDATHKPQTAPCPPQTTAKPALRSTHQLKRSNASRRAFGLSGP